MGGCLLAVLGMFGLSGFRTVSAAGWDPVDADGVHRYVEKRNDVIGMCNRTSSKSFLRRWRKQLCLLGECRAGGNSA